MNFLLDTQLLIWAVDGSERLPVAARDLILDADNQFYFSAASVWEIAIKHARGKPDFEAEPNELRDELLVRGYEELAVTGKQAAAVALLPQFHKDPFDRLLLAQAMAEGLTLMTADRQLARYPGPILRV